MMNPPDTKASILVVDDTQYNLDFLTRILVKRGYEVHPAANGPSALEIAQATPVDLILLDIMMPDMSGYEVCERLKADAGTRDIPVIFLSALSEVPDKVKAFSLGGVDYITKPFRSEEVLARIETHLTLRRLQISLEDKNAQLQAEIAVRKAVEESLRQRTQELESRNEELDAFAHTVAHDLKNPLHIVKGYAALLESEMHSEQQALTDEQIDLLLVGIANGANKMNAIIDGLLVLAGVRKQTGDLLTELNMASIVAEAYDRQTNLIKEHHAEIRLPAEWPAALGYDQWVEEIWANYLSNAIKYGGHPPLIVVGATAQPDGMVRFWVRDNGAGLSQEQQRHLFTPFTRLHQERTGHGLGLSIVQRIAEKLGGQVGVDSQPGSGSTFWFSLLAATH